MEQRDRVRHVPLNALHTQSEFVRKLGIGSAIKTMCHEYRTRFWRKSVQSALHTAKHVARLEIGDRIRSSGRRAIVGVDIDDRSVEGRPRAVAKHVFRYLL